VFCNLQPHNFVDRQPSVVGCGSVSSSGPWLFATAVTNIAFAVVLRAISTVLPTAPHATAVIADITIATTIQSNAILFVSWAVAIGMGCIVDKRVRKIGITGAGKITGIIVTAVVVVDDFVEIAVGHFHYFFYQRFVFLCIPFHFSRLLRFQELITALNICSLGDLLGNFFPT